MGWTVNLTITNNTKYNIDVVNNDAGQVGEITQGQTFHWQTSDPNNADALQFWDATVSPKTYYMQGGVNFGPEAGVYMDRGWMADGDQSIVLNADANGVRYTQSQNGGATVLAWNQFEQGGNIHMTFNPT
jgi:hypothetical protein|tara:strand:+ start:26 stop:415 length:390 start_codon:yes stop_codon:yes gene_type:complete